MRNKNAIKNIFSSLMLQIVTLICGFVIPKMIIESYGSAVNGLLNSITQFLAYITLLESGFGPVVKSILYKPIAKKDKTQIAEILKATEKFFRRIAFIFILYIVGLIAIFPIITPEFDWLFTVTLIIIIAASTFSEYFFGMTYKLFLQADQKTYITSNIQLVTTIVNTIFVVTLISIGTDIRIVKIASAVLFVLRPLIQNLYVKKKYAINLREDIKPYHIKQKWDGLAQHIAAVIHGNTDVAVLTLFSNIAEVSVYSVYLLIINGVKNVVNSFIGGIDAIFGDMIAKNEHENLNRKFKLYELMFHTISTVAFSCTLVLIIPFMKLYVGDVTDIDYIRPLFAVLITLAEFMWAIRVPYSSLTLAAGHFKETRKGAITEVLLNICISVVLVMNFGLIGVAIGTLVAMFVRTIEFMYHSSKYILRRRQIDGFKWLILSIVESSIIYLIFMFIPNDFIENYLDWGMYALIVALISGLVVCVLNFVACRKNAGEAIGLIRRGFRLKKD